MKKLMCLLLTMSLLVTAVACGDKKEEIKDSENQVLDNENLSADKSSDVYINSEYNRKNMKNIFSEAVELTDENILYGNRKNGYVILCRDMSTEYKNPLGVSPLGLSDKAYVCDYISKKYIDILSDKAYMSKLTEEEVNKYYQDMFANSFYMYAFVIIDKEDDESKKTYESVKDKYEKDEIVCETEESEYHFLYNDNYDKLDLLEEDKNDIDLIFAEYDNIKRNLILFTKVEPKALNETSSLNEFETEDVDGNKVNQDIFSEYEITMVNIWATHCGPCIDEMDELQKVYEQLPEGVNLISICEDGAEELDLTNEILEKKGVKFQTLVSSESLKASILKNITATPTTIFIDKDGNIVGNEIIGAPGSGDEVIEAYLDLIKEKLEK